MDIGGVLKALMVLNVPNILSGGILLFGLGMYVYCKKGDFGIKNMIGTIVGLLLMASVVRYASGLVWGSLSKFLLELGKLS